MNVHVMTFLFSILAAFATMFAGLRCVHMLQLESYQPNMYRKWIARGGKADFFTGMLVGMAALFLRLGYMFLHATSVELAAILWHACDAVYILGMLYMGFSNKRKKDKKPLVFTGRIKRMLLAVVLVCFVLHMNLGIFMKPDYTNLFQFLLVSTLRYLPGIVLPYTILVAYYITLPVEKAIQKHYLLDAKKKLEKQADLMKIGLTGSFGKTSTKFMLGTILLEKYKTLVTPGSYNTPMGVTRTIRESLTDDYTVFVAEMGARYPGDITELCALVEPKIGLITSVGKQHLETFGSFEAIVKTKSELLRALPADGAAFINGDIAECRQMYMDCPLANKFLFGIDGENLYMRAKDISVGPAGSTFTLICEDGEEMPCETVLLGRHNICNLVGAASVARYLGLTMQEIANGIQKIEPVAHRLQLIKGPVTVIDDAFNANPSGTKAALEVLRAFAPANRVVVTPGMIELGDEEEAIHEEFGRDIATAANIAILVGQQRVAPIRRGLLSAGFPEENILQIATLDEVTALLPTYAPLGSVVLFENDLPDNYNE
ncbi:UDP-N-acetylmuramoyl-tripeptide--D-alanyl-D-alanine ligase [Christensenellaceae bacterium OttesenSCG-928-L17]|nr:UDP-N-acetylmuramoyl-tripeptide--D-alanyl-D-alanine ligase [Christensenellaceae bacterium OttesenSCG-928-L17]